MLKEFKEFALKGNFFDMAVGIVIGASFSTIVKSLVDDIIMPIVGVFSGGIDFKEKFINLSDGDFETLAAAKEAGLKIRLNSVVLKGQNEDSVLPLVDYAVDNGFDIAFIEEMPLGNISSHHRQQTMTLNDVIAEKVGKSYNIVTNESSDFGSFAGPARYANIEGTSSKIGFISPHSNNFCSTCNRVRVTAEGQLLLCLGNENSVDLRAILRERNYSREKLKSAIIDSMQIKPEKHDFDVSTTHIVRFMNMTGG